MKKLTIIFALIFAIKATGQQIISNENSLTAMIDGKEFKTQPRKIRIGAYNWVTANLVSPDRSLRFWFVDYDNKEATPAVGKYLIVDEKYTSEKYVEKTIKEGTFKGVAVVKYVEETKTPRMEFHVGSVLKDATGIIEITADKKGVIEGTFSMNLEGSYWKERVSATVFGGTGRLLDKMKDKGKTSATGYNYDIDPEGNGYKRQDKTDEIIITNGKFKLKYTEGK